MPDLPLYRYHLDALADRDEFLLVAAFLLLFALV